MKNTRKQAMPILCALHKIMSKYKMLYCFPSQKTLLRLLSEFHKIDIGIASINRWLRDMEDAGYIVRRRRIRWDKKLGLVFQSTMYKITQKGYLAMMDAGIMVWKELAAIVKNGIKKGYDVFRKVTKPESIEDILLRNQELEVYQKEFIIQEE